MDDVNGPPPRKKSRFFLNGKSKIESLIRGKKNGQREQSRIENWNEQNQDSSPSPSPKDDVRYASAARDIKFLPIERRHKDYSPNSTFELKPSISSTTWPQTTDIPTLNVCASNSQNVHNVASAVLFARDPASFSGQGQTQGDRSMFAAASDGSRHVRCQQSQHQSAHNTRLTESSYDPFVDVPRAQPNSSNEDTLSISSPSSYSRPSVVSSLRTSPVVSHGNKSSQHNTAISMTYTPLKQTLPQHEKNPQAATTSMSGSTPFDARHDPRTTLVSSSILGQSFYNPAVDIDRDEKGTLVPSHIRQHETQLFSKPLPVRSLTREAPVIPANLYTSPKRIEHAIANSKLSLKRKQGHAGSPPAAHIYIHTGDPNFNIFSHGFLLYPELCFVLAAQMPLRDLVSLYAVSKDFHTIIDTRFTTMCLSLALRKAPQSAQIFKFRSYAHYCRRDPAARIPHLNPANAASQMPRQIPSFRWVAFVFHREKVVNELIAIFAERGCPLPARCNLALKKMWMLMDLPDNARRIAFIHNHRVYTDLDLYFLMCFFVKLDMVANDPVASDKRDGLRKLLLSQRGGLDIILKVLKREMWRKKSEYLVAWVKTTMNIENLTEDRLREMGVENVFGVPKAQIGGGKFEYWGLRGIVDETTNQRRPYLLRPDQLVMREAIRRGLRFDNHFMRCVLYGYVRPDTLESYAPRKYGRRSELLGEDYDINDRLGGTRALAVEDGGDPLLDLGNTGRGSRYTIQKEAISKQERAMREGHSRFLTEMYAISEQEQEAQGKNGVNLCSN